MLKSFKLFTIVFAISLFFSSIFGANIGEEIKNSALISYTIGGVDKNATTNEVTAFIAINQMIKIVKIQIQYNLHTT